MPRRWSASLLHDARDDKFSLSSTRQHFPRRCASQFHKAFDLRYGENPHQKAALYSDGSGKGVANGKQLQGKELSYNNIVDLQAAWDLAQEFDEPVVRHHQAHQPLRHRHRAPRWRRPISAPWSAIRSRRLAASSASTASIDAETAAEMAKLFVEVIAAPSFDDAARARSSPPRRTCASSKSLALEQKWVLKNVSGGVLVQDNDVRPLTEADLKVVSKRKPTEQEMRDLLFAWKVCKHVKSNAILYARDGQSAGVGAGQMSRVDSARIGAMKSVLGIEGSVAASDAFFPFPDGVEVIAEGGATAIIQPGGSVRDQEVIDTADRLGLAMVFTGVRHFRH